MGLVLRPTQIEAANIAEKYLKAGGDGGFIYGSCGWGKSLVIAEIAHRLNAPTLILQPSKELLEQNYQKILSYNIDGVSIYSDSMKQKNLGFVTYATIGSIYKKPELFKDYKYILIDECHRVSPKDMEGMYGTFFRALGNPPKLGLTGSPYRIIQKFVKEKVIKEGKPQDEVYYTSVVVPLNRIPNKKAGKQDMPTFLYKNMIYKVEMQELIKQGWLCQPEYDLSYSSEYDYTKLKMNTTGANFDEDALNAFLMSPNRLKQAFQGCMDYQDRGIESNLVFCASVPQALELTRLLKKAGASAETIHSGLKVKEREYLLAKFANRELTHLVNFNILHTGYDYPGLQLVTNARPLISPETYVQICGRVVRKDPNNPSKKAIVNDVAGVTKRMGRAETITLAKEEGGFRDEVVSEVGVLSNKALFKFRVESDKLKKLTL